MRPALLLALLLGAAPALAKPPGKGLPLAPCQLGAADSPVRVPARCGTLEVPEDHDAPGARTVKLFVAVVEAESTSAAPDPVFLLAGGPGQAASEAFPPVLGAFQRVGRRRDLVLVDQRGTGRSGKLACPEVDAPGAVDRSDAESLRLLRGCAAALAQRADLTRYSSLAHARDLDRVRAALGYERVNLVGGSYGTRAALVYARAFPDRVRALVLDGVAPFEMAIGGSFEEDAQRALELAARRCAAEPGCRARTPDLLAEVGGLAAELDRRPARVRLRDPLTGEPRALELTGDALRGLVFLLLYTPEGTSLLPALLREGRTGDLGPLVAQGLIGGRDLQAAMSRALQLSVVCSEDAPFYGPPPAAAASFLGTALRASFRDACALWPRAPVEAAFHAPFRADLPALLLSGEADPVTPPRWAELLRQGLPRGRHLVVPGAAHGTLHRGCVPRLVARFLADGTAEGLDAACLERSRTQPFFLDLAGPPP